jgi:predicted transcriptional regulator
MSDTERVRAWRQRLKDGGLVPMTVWVKPETKARYQDLATRSHRSGSELVQLALDAYRLDPAAVAAPVTDTAQLRALVREELDEAMAIITATITAIVTDTARETLPALVETALQRYVSDTVAETEAATPQEPRWLSTAEAFVSDMATATETAGSALPQEPLAPSVSDTETDTVTATMAPTGADLEAAAEPSPAPHGRRTARGPARRRKAPTPSN